MKLLTFFSGLLASASASAIMPITVPVADSWGFAGLAILLSLAGIIALKKRK